jgi:D-inositol-3-phosphate glycosyltransferase
MRRIALISDHASPLAVRGGRDAGGQNEYVAQIADRLARAGHQVDVFTRRDREDLPAVLEYRRGLRVVHVPAGPAHAVAKEELLPYMERFGAFVTAFARADARGYDVVHANFWMSALVAARMKQELGVPFVVTFHALGRVRRLHQGEADRFPPERAEIEQAVMREAAAIVAECPRECLDLQLLYGASRDALRMIPCGVDERRFFPIERARARRALALGVHEPLLLYVGRLVARKGLAEIIEAVARLRDAGRPVRLLVVGGEPHRPGEPEPADRGPWRTCASAHGVSACIDFVGPRGGDQLRYYYSAADCFVTAPWYEPFGLTPLEAMACGTPVVGTAVGGLTYTVRHGVTGSLVRPRDPAALAAAVDALLADEEGRRRCATAAVQRVRRHFHWDGIVEALAELYDGVATAHRNATRADARVAARAFPASASA